VVGYAASRLRITPRVEVCRELQQLRGMLGGTRHFHGRPGCRFVARLRLRRRLTALRRDASAVSQHEDDRADEREAMSHGETSPDGHAAYRGSPATSVRTL